MRVKRGVANRNKHKKVFKLTKGFRGSLSKVFRAANQAMMRALKHAYRDRRKKKRDFRALWIQRINAAARLEGMSYSQLINGLKKAQIEVNRKVLADLAVNDQMTFNKLVASAKQTLSA
ncbi:MAG: 50S ribosomal protein L20 [Candidatus Sericytochromatia bacterium]|nr:50S ribosomal protein L20 [Candidatus Sericytochromatia bacterium]